MPGKKGVQRSFRTASRSEVPSGRNGKHKAIITKILNDLDGLETGLCLKIPLRELPDTKVNIRSALNRASRQLEKSVATATDENFLYVWNA